MDAVMTVPGYTLDGVIGRGGFGVVHLATDPTGQTVAVKVLNRPLDEMATRRFQAEVQAMGTLAWHPGIIRIVDAGTTTDDPGRPFIVMEHMPGGSLGGVLRQEGSLDADRVTAVGVQAANALQVVHNAGLLHRDIKPDNLLLAADGTVKLSDLGIAAAASGSGRQRGTTGTVAYSAPELLAGATATTAADLYGLGATLYALLRGGPAFHRDTDESPAALILRAYREPVPDLRPDGVPDPVARVVERAMAKDPRDRPQAAQDLARELQSAREALGLPPVQIVPPGQVQPSAPAPAAAAGVESIAGRPSADERRRAQRMQKVLRGISAAAAVMVAITFVAVTDIGGFRDGGTDDAAPAEAPQDVDGDAVAPPDPDPAEDAPGEPAPLPPAPEDPPQVVAPGGPDVPATIVPVDDPVALTAVGGDVVVSTPTEVVRLAPDGTVTATAALPGVTSLTTLSGDPTLVAVAAPDQPLLLLDALTLAVVAETAITATEVTVAAPGVWAATGEGVVALDRDGTPQARAPLPGATRVAAGGGLVWATTDDGVLVAIDPTSRAQVAAADLGQGVVDLAATATGSALVVTDTGDLVRLERDGAVTAVPQVAGVTAVATGDQGMVVLLIDGRATLLEGTTLQPTGLTDAVRLWSAGPRVAVGLADPSAVVLLTP